MKGTVDLDDDLAPVGATPHCVHVPATAVPVQSNCLS